MSIKGYKVFNPDWTCRGFQYKVGETYEHNGNIGMCGKGFHFCQKASDCFGYYSFDKNNKVAEVEAIGLVETQGNKSVTDKIKIVREIEWSEVLTIVNEGKDCTGLSNTGNRNTGNRNTGDCNTGNRNTGDWNTGDWNTGNWNTGDWNTGDCNTGDWNTGNWNTGNCNTGDWNTGDRNTGDRNTGNWNTGNWNTGNWNTGDCNTGFFSTITPKCDLFEKPTNLTYNEICGLKGMKVLNWNYENDFWIYSDNMSKEEKTAHPEHETTGGYLKSIPFKDACVMMWNKLTASDKKAVLDLPNFDAVIFEKVTGINVNK